MRMTIQLSSEPLVEQAVQTAQTDDFGGWTFKPGLDALIDSLNHDLDLSEGTAGYFQAVITQVLINRLEVTRLITEHPEILDEEIRRPLVILGLPRSGTTLVHTLLALDPTTRYLRNYESCLAICPLPDLIPTCADPRIQAYHDTMEGFFDAAPQLRGINGLNFMAHGTAECQNLTAHEFVHIGWSVGSSLFSYGDWVAGCRMKSAYEMHKRLLQVLQWKRPNERWVLKAPMHLFGLDQLLKTYPDAEVIFTHRDPVKAMVSGVSLVYHWTEFSTQQANLPAIAQWYPRLFAKGLERALTVRQDFPAKQFFDIFHDRLSSDPVEVVREVYKHFNIHFSPVFEKRCRIWLTDNPRSKFGSHTYTAQTLGLNPETEQNRFSFYREKFDV